MNPPHVLTRFFQRHIPIFARHFWSWISNLYWYSLRNFVSSSKVENLGFASIYPHVSNMSTNQLWILHFFSCTLCSCRVSRLTLRGKSSESTTPRMKLRYRGSNSSNSSMMSTFLTYSFSPPILPSNTSSSHTCWQTLIADSDSQSEWQLP